MSLIDNLINIAITQQSAAVAQAAFGVPLFMGPTNPGWAGGDYVHTYSDPAQLLTDGFTPSSPEYIEAKASYQNDSTKPALFMVGRRSTAVAQVNALTVNTLTASHVYRITVNGTVYSYTASGADTQQSILTALLGAISAVEPVTGTVTGTGGSAALTLTASNPGQIISYTSPDSSLTLSSVTAANGIAQDVQNVRSQNDGWYALATPQAGDADILQGAAAVESLLKIYGACSATTAIGSSTSTTDIASVLSRAGYNRTFLTFSPNGFTKGLVGQWLGLVLPSVPGSTNWAYKTLAGQTPDALTANQASVCIGSPVNQIAGKNVNIYQLVGGVNVTLMGTMASGRFIDTTIGQDWLQSGLQADAYAVLANSPKVPMTDVGVTPLLGAVQNRLALGVSNGLLDPASIKASIGSVSGITPAQRRNRVAPAISFGARFAGAANAVAISGTLTF